MIEGERVRLRKLEKADLPLLHRWLNDQDLMAWARFSPDHMVSLAALEKEYERELAGEDRDRTTYMIEEKDTGKPIGWCTVRTWDRKHVNANVGIGLGEKEEWGTGYGTEAMGLLLTILFDHQGWHRAELWTLAENERAIRSFEKCGFRREGLEKESTYSDGRYRDIVLMGLLKSEWDAPLLGALPPERVESFLRFVRTSRRRGPKEEGRRSDRKPKAGEPRLPLDILENLPFRGHRLALLVAAVVVQNSGNLDLLPADLDDRCVSDTGGSIRRELVVELGDVGRLVEPPQDEEHPLPTAPRRGSLATGNRLGFHASHGLLGRPQRRTCRTNYRTLE